MATDWAWCYENPHDAAAEIDRLARELAEARTALQMIATYREDDGQCDNGYGPGYVARKALAAADQPAACTCGTVSSQADLGGRDLNCPRHGMPADKSTGGDDGR